MHISFCISAVLIVLTAAAGNLSVPAGRCRCSPRRRAFFILYLRRYGRFAGGGVEFVFVCPLADAIVRLAGVHILFCISAGLIVSPVAAWNLSSCAR